MRNLKNINWKTENTYVSKKKGMKSHITNYDNMVKIN